MEALVLLIAILAIWGAVALAVKLLGFMPWVAVLWPLVMLVIVGACALIIPAIVVVAGAGFVSGLYEAVQARFYGRV